MAGSGFLTAEPSTMPGTGNRVEEFEGLPTEEVAADKATEYFAQLTPSLLPPFLLQGPVSRELFKSLFQPLEGRRGMKSYPGTQDPGLGLALGHGMHLWPQMPPKSLRFHPWHGPVNFFHLFLSHLHFTRLQIQRDDFYFNAHCIFRLQRLAECGEGIDS